MRQKFYLFCFMMVTCLLTLQAQEIQQGNWITNGPVYAVTQNSTNVYLGGHFDQVGRPMNNGVVYNALTGEPLSQTNYPDGQISSSASDGQGGFFIAGTTDNSNLSPSFSKIGIHARAGLAHILPNGEVSPIFNPVLSPLKSGKIVLAATTDRVIVGVKTNNPVTRTYEAKISCLSHDGSILWERNLSSNTEAHTALIHNNTLYVFGRFTSVENQPRQRAAAFDLPTGNLLAWNTGSRIPSLISTARQSIWAGISGNEIFIRCHATPTIGSQHLFSVDAATGEPTGWAMSVSGAHPMIVHHDKVYFSTQTGALQILDASTKLPSAIPSGINFANAIRSIAAEGENIYLASDGFNNGDGMPVGSVFRFNENTLAITTMNTMIYRPMDMYQNNTVTTIAVGGDHAYIGGRYPSIAMRPVSNVFGYNRSSGNWIDFSPTVVGEVTAMEAFEGRLYIGGFFQEINGEELGSELACFNLTNNQLTSWHPNAFAFDLTRWNDRLYVTGQFNESTFGAQAYEGETEALLDWTPQLPNGAAYCAADDNGVYVSTNGQIHFLSHATGTELFNPLPIGGQASGLAAANGRLFVVGDFNSLGSGPGAVDDRYVGVIDLTTGLPIESNISISPDQGWAAPLAVTASKGSVYFGGHFGGINGLPRLYTAAVNAETLLPSDWSVPIEQDFGSWSFAVSAMAAFDDGIYIGGHFGRAKNSIVKNIVVASPDRSNVVSGTVFLDNNGNGIQDTGEAGVPNILMEVQPGNFFYPTNATGQYTLYTGVGNFSITPVHPTYALSLNPGMINVSFADDLMTTANNNFAVVPYPSLTDDEIEIISDRAPRPGFEYEYSISYRNGGTINSNGTVSVTLDPRLLIESVIPPATSTNGNILQWTYTNLAPGTVEQITINARVPAPTINGSLLGEHILSTAAITTSVTDNDPSNNTATLDEVVVGSVDPNDKLVTPQGYGPNGYIDEDTDHLTYTIRFQNVGTAPAENIFLEDQFDLNLDVSTFSVVESSHPGYSYYISNRTLHVSYVGINLEDSVSNEPASHGFFTFTIGLNEGLSRGTVIQNSASIVFDYNLPLVTNTVTNTLRNAPYPLMVFAPVTEVNIGSDVSVPVMAYNFQNVLGAQFTVSWDPSVVSFEAVEGFTLPGMNENSFGLDNTDDGYLTFVWNDPALSLQSIEDSTALFNVRFNAIGAAQSQSPISVSQVPTAMEFVGEGYEVMESERRDGRITITNTIVANGHVTYANGDAVQAVTINISGDEDLSTTTGDEGAYTVTLAPEDAEASYTFTAVKTDDPGLLNGIDVQDVASIRRHILRTEVLASPYSIIAADVSNNQNVTVQDVLILQALILGVEDDFPNGRQWTFVDAAHEFQANASPFGYLETISPNLSDLGTASHDFIAVKIGEVNFTRDNSQTGRSSTQDVVLEIGQPVQTEDGNIEIDIKSFGFIDISAYQFTVQWNKDHLRYLETITNTITPQFGAHRTQEGFLTTLWDDPNGGSISLGEGSSIMKLRFEKVNEGDISSVSIVNNLTPIKMYDQVLREVSLSIRESAEEKIESGFFYPNPFRDKTKISFSASESQVAAFEVVDVMGKRMEAIEVPVQKGWNEVIYNGAGLPEGVYVFTLQLKDKQVKAKIIKRKE